jgi:nucleoside 2-deoxyribosyltransferase
MKIYLSGPLGFSEVGRMFFYDALIPCVSRTGFDVIDPWKLTSESKVNRVAKMPYGSKRRNAWRRLNVEIGGNGVKAIDKCDAVLAVLDGTDVDSGTASEVGYAFARQKPILGYRGDFRLSADNDGSIVNLQVEYFILQSGGEIVSTLAALPAALRRLKNMALAKVGAGR